jgi:hypothetical protein
MSAVSDMCSDTSYRLSICLISFPQVLALGKRGVLTPSSVNTGLVVVCLWSLWLAWGRVFSALHTPGRMPQTNAVVHHQCLVPPFLSQNIGDQTNSSFCGLALQGIASWVSYTACHWRLLGPPSTSSCFSLRRLTRGVHFACWLCVEHPSSYTQAP